MMMSAPSSTAQPTISSNMPRTSRWARLSFGSQMFVFEMLPATRSPGRASATSRAIRSACAVQRLEEILLADHPHLLAVPVVGERLDDVAARALEIVVHRCAARPGPRARPPGRTRPR